MERWGERGRECSDRDVELWEGEEGRREVRKGKEGRGRERERGEGGSEGRGGER